MKTEKTIKELIKKNEDFVNGLPIKLSEKERKLIKRAKKENKLYTELLRYIQTEPSAEFLKKEQVRLKNLISEKLKQFDYWSHSVCPSNVLEKNKMAVFSKEIGLPLLRNQLSNISFLLE